MSCSTPLGYAIGLLIAAAVAFWLGVRWEKYRPPPKDEAP